MKFDEKTGLKETSEVNVGSDGLKWTAEYRG
jgi:hypothetical protein